MKKIFIAGLVMFVVGTVFVAIASPLIGKADLQKTEDFLNKYTNRKDIQIVVDGVNQASTSTGEGSPVGFNFSKAYKFDAVEKLQLDANFGDIEIVKSDGDELVVTLTTTVFKKVDADKIVYKEGNSARINLIDAFKNEEDGKTRVQITDHGIRVSHVLKLKVEVPKQYKQLSLDTVSADYKIKNIDLIELNINNVSGDFVLDQVKALSAKIKSVSGDLDFKDLDFENIKLDTVSGDASFKFKAPADLSAEISSISGDMDGDDYFEKYISDKTLKLGEPKKKITINSVSGDIEFSKGSVK